MAIFDSVVFLVLLRCKPPASVGWLGINRRQAALASGIFVAVLATAAFWYGSRPGIVVAKANTPSAVATQPPNPAIDPFGRLGSLVMLQPQNLVNKPLLIASHIDIGETLRTGPWIVLLVHHDCDHCAAAVPRYQALMNVPGGVKLAIVQMPPYAEEDLPWSSAGSVAGKLDTTRDWFATTPLALLADNGIIRAAKDGENAVNPDPSWFHTKKR